MVSTQDIQSPRHLSLRNRLGFLFRDSLLYGGASAISRSFSLITFPILARHFSVAEYGQLDFFMVLASLLALMVIFGQDSAVGRFFYEDDDINYRREVVSQSLLLQFLSCAVIVPLLWLAASWINPFLVDHPQKDLFYKIVLLQLPFLVVINFSVNLLKFSFARAQFLMMSLGTTVVQAVALVVAILVFDAGIREILLIGLAVSASFSILGLFFVRRWLTWPRQLTRIREMLLFAVPFGIICVTGAFSPTLERTITERLLGSEPLGLYAVGVKIAMLMGLVVSAFQTAWGPFSLSLFNQADAARTYNLVFKGFAFTVCLVAFGLALSSSLLIQLLATERYATGTVVVFPLALGLAIQATSWITEIGIAISKKSYLGLFGYASMLLTTLILIWQLTPLVGLWGVGLSVLAGHIVRAIVASWLAQQVYPLAWEYRPVLILMAASLLIGLLGSAIGYQYSIQYANGIYAAGFAMVFFSGFFILFSATERQAIFAFAAKRIR